MVAATNRDLAALVSTKQFRSDLYYRLDVFPVSVPALRDRPEDIPLLAMHFVKTFAGQMGKHIDKVPMVVMEALINYSWPGKYPRAAKFHRAERDPHFRELFASATRGLENY